MLEPWILDQLDPLRPAPLIILRDPQRMIQKGAYVVDGWGEQHGYSVLLCQGNLALREMYETVRDDPEAHVLLVDRSRDDAKSPLFYPDLDAAAGPSRQLRITLRDYLAHASGDPHWPRLVDQRQLAALVLANLPGTLEAHGQLREVDESRFTDSDLFKIVLGATLGINPFRRLTPSDVRRVCISQHAALDTLKGALPSHILDGLRAAIASAPAPFCWLWDHDPLQVIRAYALSALMHQHALDYGLLLSNLDPQLHAYREIDSQVLDEALREQLTSDPDCVLADVQDAETFLKQNPARLALLLRDGLKLEQRDQARATLECERLSPLVRSLALISLLADLILDKDCAWHAEVVDLLDRQNAAGDLLALRCPPYTWQTLERVYRRAVQVFRLARRHEEAARQLRVAAAESLTFETFDLLWNQECLSRLDYFGSDLDRMMRVGDLLPVPRAAFWPELLARWEKARSVLTTTLQAIAKAQSTLDGSFQDLLRLHYSEWIGQADSPAVFTHQFLPRVLKAHWDPRTGQKAFIMVFDGLRTDAWEELLRPVLEERFDLISSRPGCSLLPSETELSRKAISAGCLPDAFVSQRELTLLQDWLQRELGLTPAFEVVRDDDTIASGMAVRYVSDVLDYVVFSFSDRSLHNNPQDMAFIYDTTVREVIRQDVRSVLRELPDDALVFVVSDHGFARMPRRTVTVPDALVNDPNDVKYRHARARGRLQGQDADKVLSFDARRMGLPDTRGPLALNTVLFPRPGYILRREKGHRDPDTYSHGGLSLAECMVPMAVLGPRHKAQPLLTIEDVHQVGSVMEGDALTLEIKVAKSLAGSLPVTLSFSREEIPLRREVLSDAHATFGVQWQPRLGAIDEAERQGGVVKQAITVIVTFQRGGRLERVSRSLDVRIKLDSTRLRRRVDSKLDLLMGKVPKGLQS
jgi:hypothetical protein